MKYLPLICFLMLTSLAIGQPEADSAVCTSLLKSSEFTVVETVHEIAPWVFLKFTEWEKMSDPGKKFISSEKKNNSHKRRLFFAAHSGDNWIVSYEHMGSDYHAHCIFITVNERNEISVFDACNEFKTLEVLKTTVLSLNLPIEKWDGIEY